MFVSELADKLLSEGCTQNSFAVLSRQSDAYCLDKVAGKWSVFYSERGVDSEPLYTSKSESEACKYFYDLILNLEHLHLVGFFKLESQAFELVDKLAGFEIQSIRNDIPAYNTANDPRYRVFVIGADIFKVKNTLGEFEIKYT
ncbi:SPOR domain-containing protein [Shewanella electrodiphila]|uniref:SPOR domain-containing protein n=1 Tax=Shewanella electrodiphila TaxID=934143 RepID=A0ABT0KSW0_9GAMM|nr:SPOR domain-containing protein [Shewanella electrodiphila]MCL1046945.1 SPOR domain-containing protein [Shewanella electrodiphila]